MNKEFGDFQTPHGLVRQIIERLLADGFLWTRVLEPTCGRGNFIRGLVQRTPTPIDIQGFEVQADYVAEARQFPDAPNGHHVTIHHRNVFDVDFARDIRWRHNGPMLVIGNPPWITNSELGSIGSTNLPIKTNFKSHKGIDALTGDSNFDISEYIWIKLIEELAKEKPTIVLLCKVSVARSILQYIFDRQYPVSSARLYKIDAKKWFDASVDACLFRIDVASGGESYDAQVYPDLTATRAESTMGFRRGRIIADTQRYDRYAYADGSCSLNWRQGVKHDVASIMELTRSGATYRNKLGDIVDVEAEYAYPLMKSADIFGSNYGLSNRYVLVTQSRLGEDTRVLAQTAPKLWQYLMSYAPIFQRRQSSIYRNQPQFAMFGIGSYSFSPYKVCVSGLHKLVRFRAIGPQEARPVMLDDTSYFLPCTTPEQAAILVALLNHPECIGLIKALAFLEAKRPITKRVLQRVDLTALCRRIEQAETAALARLELGRLLPGQEIADPIFQQPLEGYLVNGTRAMEF